MEDSFEEDMPPTKSLFNEQIDSSFLLASKNLLNDDWRNQMREQNKKLEDLKIAIKDINLHNRDFKLSNDNKNLLSKLRHHEIIKKSSFPDVVDTNVLLIGSFHEIDRTYVTIDQRIIIWRANDV